MIFKWCSMNNFIAAKFIDHYAANKLDLSRQVPTFKTGKDVSRIAIEGFGEQLQIAAKKKVNFIEKKLLFKPLEVKIGDDFKEIHVNINSLSQRTGISKARIKAAKTGAALAQLIHEEVVEKSTKQCAVQAILKLHQEKKLSTQEKKFIPLLVGAIQKFSVPSNKEVNQQLMERKWPSVWSIAAAIAPIELFEGLSLKIPGNPESVGKLLIAAVEFERPKVIHSLLHDFKTESEDAIDAINRFVTDPAEAEQIYSVYSNRLLSELEIDQGALPAEAKDHNLLSELEIHQGALPAEVKEYILSFLEPKDIPQVAAVNTLWQAQVETSSLKQNAKKLASKVKLLFKKTGGEVDYQPEQIDQFLNAIDEVKIRQPAILKALGGLLNVQQLPVLELKGLGDFTDYIDFIEPDMMSAPVMRGLDSCQRPFIAFKYMINEGGQTVEYVETLFQRYIGDINTWTHGCKYLEHLFLGMDRLRNDNRDFYLERVQRLMKGEELPLLQRGADGKMQEKQGGGEKIRLAVD
ncbi:MAG: hypothetical protein K0S07_970 [Chlamydiales bacterium]|jgi:hypothetical protein|nr:hypothetical protein [Chlamydiales bacterium]